MSKKNFDFINKDSSEYNEYIEYCKKFDKKISNFRFGIYKIRKRKIYFKNQLNERTGGFLQSLSLFSDFTISERLDFLKSPALSEKGVPKLSLTKLRKLSNNNRSKVKRFYEKIKNRAKGKSNKFLIDFLKTNKSSVNWLKEGKVTSVKNQGLCGSCWAFAVNAAIESLYLIKKDEEYNLSEQELIDCATDMDCSGGWNDLALDYIKTNSISLEANYPYTAVDETCEIINSSKISISDYNYIESNDMFLFLQRLEKQPISVAILVTDDFLEYKSGIIDGDKQCGQKKLVNHAVTAVGYFIDENNLKSSYILFKNQWGTEWGEDGYFRMKLYDMRYEGGPCNILLYNTHTVFPIL